MSKMRSRAARQCQFLHQMQEETAGSLQLLGKKAAVQLRTGRVPGLAAVFDGEKVRGMYKRILEWMMRHEKATVILVSVLTSLLANAIMSAIGWIR